MDALRGWRHEVQRERVDIKSHRGFMVESAEVWKPAAVDELANVSEGAFIPIQRDSDSGKPQEDVNEQYRQRGNGDPPGGSQGN